MLKDNASTSAHRREALYLAVRAGLVAKGDSLNRWCIRNGFTHPYARQCLRGETNGPSARSLRKRLAKAAGLKGADD